jgi:hypothetical protein
VGNFVKGYFFVACGGKSKKIFFNPVEAAVCCDPVEAPCLVLLKLKIGRVGGFRVREIQKKNFSNPVEAP